MILFILLFSVERSKSSIDQSAENISLLSLENLHCKLNLTLRTGDLLEGLLKGLQLGLIDLLPVLLVLHLRDELPLLKGMMLGLIGSEVDCDRMILDRGVMNCQDQVKDVVVVVSLGRLGNRVNLIVLIDDLDDILRVGVDETQNVSLYDENLSD